MGDQTAKAFVDGMVASGATPEWFFALFLIAILGSFVVVAWKGFLPIYKDKVASSKAIEQKQADAQIEIDQKRIEAQIELEKQREVRKVEESKAREIRDAERSKMEGRWIEQMERSVTVQAETNQINDAIRSEMESLRIQNKALTDAINESREGSKSMLGKLDAIQDFIKESK